LRDEICYQGLISNPKRKDSSVNLWASGTLAL